MPDQQARAVLAATIGQIRQHVPRIAPYFEIEHSLGDYASRLPGTHVAPAHADRQSLVARAVGRVLRQALGPAAGRLDVDARDLRAVNVVDHHQLLNHPLLLGTNVIANADLLLGARRQRPIVTFSCSNVSPGNEYMRNGFQFRGRTVPYFTAKEGRHATYYIPARPMDFVERLRALRRWELFGPEDQEFLAEYQRYLNSLDYSHTGRHRDQVAVILRATWPRLFSPELRPYLPELLYANTEDVARRCLIDMLDEQNFITCALFDASFRGRVLDAFRGIVVAWDEEAGKGTHFFWRKHPERPTLLRMFVRGGSLVPDDPRFRDLSVPLESAALRDHLEREQVIPSIALCTSLLLYAGIKPLVGTGSLVYTTELKEGWTTLLEGHGFSAEADLMKMIDTGGLISGAPVFFARDGSAVRALAAADVFSLGGMPRSYLRKVLSVPFKEILSVGASGIYELFSGSYIPKGVLLTDRIDFHQAASVIHEWL
jgi:hypothetical protein